MAHAITGRTRWCVFIGSAAVLLAVMIVVFIFATSGRAPAASPDSRLQWQEEYGQLPISFEANLGQTNSQVKYLSHGRGYTLFLTPTEAVMSLSNPAHNSGALHGTDATSANAPTGPEAAQNATFRMRLIGSNEHALVTGLRELPGRTNYLIGNDPSKLATTPLTGLRELPGRTNYLIGNDPSKWHTDIPTYASVEYQQVYPGIDLLYYGNRRQLEYDFILAPGANPDSIRLGLSGTRQPKIDPDGDLVLPVGDGELRLRKPTVYQKIGGIHSPVERVS